MNRRPRRVTRLLLALLVLPGAGGAAAAAGPPDADTLVARVATTWAPLHAVISATMITRRAGREPLVVELRILRAGQGRTRIDFLSPPKDQGKIILQIGNETWLYLPNAGRAVEVPPRRNPLAAGVLFEDLLPGESGEVVVEDREDAYVLVSLAPGGTRGKRRGTDRTYFRRDTLLPFRREFYGASGRLLRTVYIEEIRDWRGVSIPWKIRFVDHLRQGTEATIEIRRVEDLVGDTGDLFSREGLGPGPRPEPSTNDD